MKAELHITVESEAELVRLSWALGANYQPLPKITGSELRQAIPLPRTMRRHRLNKVTRKVARSLIRKGGTNQLIAHQLGVSTETIRRLRLGLTWKKR